MGGGRRRRAVELEPTRHQIEVAVQSRSGHPPRNTYRKRMRHGGICVEMRVPCNPRALHRRQTPASWRLWPGAIQCDDALGEAGGVQGGVAAADWRRLEESRLPEEEGRSAPLVCGGSRAWRPGCSLFSSSSLRVTTTTEGRNLRRDLDGTRVPYEG